MKDTVKQSIDLYVEHGTPPGEFLEAVLADSLTMSWCRADDQNRKDLAEIAGYIYTNLGCNCWGSRGAVDAWMAAHRKAAREQELAIVEKARGNL